MEFNPFRADLHTHTTCSDGTTSPEELVNLAVEKGLQGLAITDHDTIAGYQMALPHAKKKGLLLGRGVELSSMHKDCSIDVLCYDFEDVEKMERYCKEYVRRREERNEKLLTKLRQNRMPLDEIETTSVIGRPHLAAAMVKKGYVENDQEAFTKYLGEGKPCYVPRQSFTVSETIENIHACGGKALLAHPHRINKKRILRDLLNLPIDGLEVYYSTMPKSREEPFMRLVEEHGWFYSGGSDFHGERKFIPLGCSWVNEEVFRRLFRFI